MLLLSVPHLAKAMARRCPFRRCPGLRRLAQSRQTLDAVPNRDRGARRAGKQTPAAGCRLLLGPDTTATAFAIWWR